MSDLYSFFVLRTSDTGVAAAKALSEPERALARTFRLHFFDEVAAEFWAAAPRERPVGCLLELAQVADESPRMAALRIEEAAERLDAHGVSVFVFTTQSEVPVEWARSFLTTQYHFLDLSQLSSEALQETEEAIIGHVHFARFAEESEVQVYVPSAVKFLRSRQRLEQECFVMSAAERSPARSKCFVRLLARHVCADFNAIEIERLDCTIDDLLEAPGISFSPELPYYLIDRALVALNFLHDWSDIGLHTFGDFSRLMGLPLRQFIPGSAYFRHFRHVARDSLDRLPFRIIHCDLKPGNVLLQITDECREKLERGEGEIDPGDVPGVRLFDFDLCRYLQPSPGSSGSEGGPEYTGTYGYTAPELFLAKGNAGEADVEFARQITPLVDFYAVGTIFYELLARQPLIPRDLLDVREEDYYPTATAFHDSDQFPSRLAEVRDPDSRALISACSQPRQADRDIALRRLLPAGDRDRPTTASDIRKCLPHKH